MNIFPDGKKRESWFLSSGTSLSVCFYIYIESSCQLCRFVCWAAVKNWQSFGFGLFWHRFRIDVNVRLRRTVKTTILLTFKKYIRDEH